MAPALVAVWIPFTASAQSAAVPDTPGIPSGSMLQMLLALALIVGGISALVLGKRLHHGAAIFVGTVTASLLFASLAWVIGLFFILAPIAIWLYTLVFIFSTLWFGHFCLRALELLREENQVLDAEIITRPAPESRTPTAQPPITLPNSTASHDDEH